MVSDLKIRGSATSDTLVPTSCTSRVVGDSERDPLHSELIHPVIGEAATAQHTITYQQSCTAQLPYRPIHPHHSAHSEFYKERAPRPSRTLSLIERSERFPDCLLVRFLWQSRGLKHPFSITSLPTISSTSPCRLQPIYYSRVSAAIRLSKILVHTPSLAPLPLSCGPGHTRHRAGSATDLGCGLPVGYEPMHTRYDMDPSGHPPSQCFLLLDSGSAP